MIPPGGTFEYEAEFTPESFGDRSIDLDGASQRPENVERLVVREISTRDCERFKSMLGKAETPRNDLRSGSTVNRYMALLSGVCKRAIKDELMSANPCSQIDEEPENSRARYLTVEEQIRLFAVLKDDLGFLNAPITVTLGTGMRKGIELLKLKVGHLNFSSRPLFYPVRGGSAEIPSNWLIVVQGKGNKYRLIPMNSQVRDTLFCLSRDRPSDEFVFDKDVNDVNNYALRWGFEEACTRAELLVKPFQAESSGTT